jgi:hypothetical protein
MKLVVRCLVALVCAIMMCVPVRAEIESEKINQNAYISPCGNFRLFVYLDAEDKEGTDSNAYEIRLMRSNSSLLWDYSFFKDKHIRQSWPSEKYVITDMDISGDGVPDEIVIQDIDEKKVLLEIFFRANGDVELKN